MRLEERLRQAHKMEAIGTLAGGIAHDFNNILYPVMGYAELAIEEVPNDSSAALYMGEIVRATERAKSLVSQILKFSKPAEEKQGPMKLSSVLREVLTLMRGSLPSTIRIQERIEDYSGLIMGDATQIHQVVMNLCTNAYQAMGTAGGALSISLTREVLSGTMPPVLSSLDPGEYLKVTISDTGKGMEPQVVSRIFEPYFTTRDQGGGSGMGLAMVHSIMAKHRGDILVDTTPGEGTIFSLYFPVLQMKGYAAPEQVEPRALGGNESILLVDDELSITKMLKMALERLGYTVTTLDNSLEALEEFKGNHHAYQLVIVDMTMPHMTGDVLIEHMRKIRPDIPFILCSGYSDKIDHIDPQKLGVFKILDKPLSTKTLAAVVREALDR